MFGSRAFFETQVISIPFGHSVHRACRIGIMHSFNGSIWQHEAACGCRSSRRKGAHSHRNSRQKVSAPIVPAPGLMVLPYMDACGCIWPHTFAYGRIHIITAQGCCSSRRKVSAPIVPAAGPMEVPYMDESGCIWPHTVAYGYIWPHMATNGCILWLHRAAAADGESDGRMWLQNMATQSCCGSRRKVSAPTVPASGRMVFPCMEACGCMWLRAAT